MFKECLRLILALIIFQIERERTAECVKKRERQGQSMCLPRTVWCWRRSGFKRATEIETEGNREKTERDTEETESDREIQRETESDRGRQKKREKGSMKIILMYVYLWQLVFVGARACINEPKLAELQALLWTRPAGRQLYLRTIINDPFRKKLKKCLKY